MSAIQQGQYSYTSSQTAPNKGAKQGYFQDVFSRAATAHFKAELSKPAPSLTRRVAQVFEPDRRILVAGHGNIAIVADLSSLSKLFWRVICALTGYAPDSYWAYLKENREALTQFREHLIRECGQDKVDQIAADYGINLDIMMKEGSPVLPHHVYMFNIGMNHLEMSDVSRLTEKLYALFTARLTGDTPLQACFNHPCASFTEREKRGMIALVGEQGTLASLQLKFGNIDSRFPEDFPPDTFNALMEVLSTPNEAWGDLFTGKKWDGVVQGAYTDTEKRSAFHPWLDQQELLAIFPQLKGAETDAIYNELLAKIVVKKHPIILNRKKKEWRVGSLIPAPSKDGKARWLKVQDGVDSGLGKYWITLTPATNRYDHSLGVYRVYRDTSICRYAQGGAGTLLRSVASDVPPGYLYSDSTKTQDLDFFNTISVPAEEYDAQVAQHSIHNQRPVIIVGNSLGSFDAQHDLVEYLVRRNHLPTRPIHLYCHSPLRIHKQDNEAFLAYLEKHKTKAHIKIDYIFQDIDPVPHLGGDTHALLGEGAHANIRVYKVPEKTGIPEVDELVVHCKRLEQAARQNKITLVSQTRDYAIDPSFEKWRKRGAKLAGAIIRAGVRLKRALYSRRGMRRDKANYVVAPVYSGGLLINSLPLTPELVRSLSDWERHFRSPKS